MPIMDGLQLTFDAALDGHSWPGPLGSRSAAIGEAWLGPLGLLARLETELGLLAPKTSSAQRAADLGRQLAGRDGFWRASFEADPMATCRRLLTDRDTLALWGWSGEPAGERLGELWRATTGASPGIADRLRRILALLPRRSVDLTSIRIVEPVATLPPVWRMVFDALERAGVRIELAPLVNAPARGDLAGARQGGFEPVGDGTLQLVRPHGPLAAADEVAAALSVFPDLHEVVIIGADSILDEAMVRYGLPRLGSDRPGPSSSTIVRLVIESAFTPMDPTDLHALLCMDPGPIPRGVAGRLAGALQQFPSRAAESWTRALAEGLAGLEDEDRRSSVQERLRALLEPVVDREAVLPIEALAVRLRTLSMWARGRLASAPTLASLISFAEGVISLARTMGGVALSRVELRRLCDEVDPRTTAGPPAEAGINPVPQPGAILGPARHVIWWGFTRDRALAPPRLRLSEQESAMLRAAGVTPPDAGAAMAAEARRWRRPLTCSTGSLILVCPKTNEARDAAHPHPLWDELCAAMVEPAAARLLVASTITSVAARRTRAVLRPLPRAFDTARAPQPIALRPKESASSLEKLLGCSLAYALTYAARIPTGLGTGPQAPAPRLFGTLAHHILAQVFSGGALTPDAAAARAEAIVDASLAGLAENLALPDHQRERSALRLAIIGSAREIGVLLRETKATIRGVELALVRELEHFTLEGRADIVFAHPDLVLDYKWSTSTHRDRLEDGTAVQLATYAELGRQGEAFPGVGYLNLQNQKLFVSPGTAIPGVRPVGKVHVKDVWAATRSAIDQRRRELGEGRLVAPGALLDADESSLNEGVLRIEPGCHYCAYSTLCGKRAST